jgi:3-dehydroquinate synthetase
MKNFVAASVARGAIFFALPTALVAYLSSSVLGRYRETSRTKRSSRV